MSLLDAKHPNLKRVKSHTFRNKRYRVHTDLVIEGYTDPFKPAELYIAANLRGLAHLTTAIHEAMHAEDPEDSEQVIDRRSKSLARFLWRLGYRLS